MRTGSSRSGEVPHRRSGRREAAARRPVLIGAALVVVALAAGRGLAGVLVGFPLPVLAALLVVAAVAHARLLRDVRDGAAWLVVLAVAVPGVVWNLAVGLAAGLAVHLVLAGARRRAEHRAHVGEVVR